MQKKVRLGHQFENLQQGGMSHADFRAAWTELIQSMKEAKMDVPSEETLHRKYLMKLNPELRVSVLSKDWKIDGEDKPQRRPVTTEDLRKAVGHYLKEKADIHAAGQGQYDSLMSLDGSMPWEERRLDGCGRAWTRAEFVEHFEGNGRTSEENWEGWKNLPEELRLGNRSNWEPMTWAELKEAYEDHTVEEILEMWYSMVRGPNPEEIRYDPEAGSAPTWVKLLDKYLGTYTPEEIWEYWWTLELQEKDDSESEESAQSEQGGLKPPEVAAAEEQSRSLVEDEDSATITRLSELGGRRFPDARIPASGWVYSYHQIACWRAVCASAQ